ncbi:hypothetical protein Dimus_001824 [Dionaea muscipula]
MDQPPTDTVLKAQKTNEAVEIKEKMDVIQLDPETIEDAQLKPENFENVQLQPEILEDEKEGRASFHCDFSDTEIVYKIAQELLSGLAAACVDNTTEGQLSAEYSEATFTAAHLKDHDSTCSFKLRTTTSGPTGKLIACYVGSPVGVRSLGTRSGRRVRRLNEGVGKSIGREQASIPLVDSSWAVIPDLWLVDLVTWLDESFLHLSSLSSGLEAVQVVKFFTIAVKDIEQKLDPLEIEEKRVEDAEETNEEDANEENREDQAQEQLG